MADNKNNLPPFEAKDEIEQVIYDALTRVADVEKIKSDLVMKQAERAYNRYKKRQAQEKALNEAIENQNIVKRACAELGLTQKELAEKIGMSEGGLRTAVSMGKITTQVEKACELLLRINTLEKELKNYKILQNAIKSMNS